MAISEDTPAHQFARVTDDSRAPRFRRGEVLMLRELIGDTPDLELVEIDTPAGARRFALGGRLFNVPAAYPLPAARIV